MIKNDALTQLKYLVGDQKPEYCNQCGKCTSVCPVAKFIDFNPRKIVVMVQLGMAEEVLNSDEIWNCAQCLSCKERCPREVSPYDTIQALRNIAIGKGLPHPKGYQQYLKSIYKLGIVKQAKPVRSRTRKYYDRRSLGLPAIKRLTNIKKFTEALDKTMSLEGKKY